MPKASPARSIQLRPARQVLFSHMTIQTEATAPPTKNIGCIPILIHSIIELLSSNICLLNAGLKYEKTAYPIVDSMAYTSATVTAAIPGFL